MKVKVKLFATFRNNRFKEKDYDLPPGFTVGEVIAMLSIPEKEVGVLFVNGKSVEMGRPLADGDTLSIFPMVGGG
ncbi:MoaD/ThiS family protein [Syntrophomonas erecta]